MTEPVVAFSPLEALSGMRPGLVVDLAELDGENKENILAVIREAFFGDRILLSAYKLVELRKIGGNLRVEAINDSCLEVIKLVAAVVASIGPSPTPKALVDEIKPRMA